MGIIKYEYKIRYFEYSGCFPFSFDNFEENLNEYGNNGWELIYIDNSKLIFKRIKE